MLGRDLFKDDPGREGGFDGLSGGKKLDLLLRGDGDGGICDNVSMVRSDREGLGLLGSVWALLFVGIAASFSNGSFCSFAKALAAGCWVTAAVVGFSLADPIKLRAS